jgi:excisionase family DNA binding protein
MDELIITKRQELTKLIESAVRKELNTCLSPHSGSKSSDDEVFTNKQAMSYLHVSRSTLQRWRKSGQLPYRKVEGKILYTKSDLKQLLKSAAK